MKYESKYIRLGDALLSIKTGLNPRKNFKLNVSNAKHWYITVSELNGIAIKFLPQTDRIDDLALEMINNRSNLEIGDVLFSGTGTIGKTAIILEKPSSWNIKEGVYALKPKKDCMNSYYLLYMLQYFCKLNTFTKLAAGSTVFSVPMKVLTDMHIDLPSLVIQQRIAAVLSSLDAKIELNNRINAELEAMAKTLYDYWFVQFDFPDKNGKPYKSSGGKMVWSTELKREIPEGWDAGTLGDIADIVRGVTYDSTEIKCETDSDVIPVLRATNISKNVIDLNDMVYVPKENVSSEQVLNKFDILIVMSSGSKEHIGKNAFFHYDQEVSFGAFCAKIVAKDEFKFYLYSYTQSDFLFTTIKNECLGTNINNLNGTLVKGFKIVIPPKTLIRTFNKKVSSVYAKTGVNIIENQKLASIRDWLLPMLMNGQVKVQ